MLIVEFLVLNIKWGKTNNTIIDIKIKLNINLGINIFRSSLINGSKSLFIIKSNNPTIPKTITFLVLNNIAPKLI